MPIRSLIQPHKRAYILFFVVMLCGTVGLVLMTSWYNSLFTKTSRWVAHTLDVLAVTQRTSVDLHNPDAYRLQTLLAADISSLRKLVSDNPVQQARIDSLGFFLAKRDPAGMSNLLLRMQTEEYRLLELRQAENDRSRTLLKGTIFTLLLLIFTLLCISAFLVLYNFNRRRKAELVLKESEEHLDLLVRHVKDYAIVNLDKAGNILSWNEGAGQIKGYSEEEVLGRHLSIFYPDEDIRLGEPGLNLQRAAQEGRYETIGKRKRKDGSLFWADVVFTAMHDKDGELTGFIKITRDITEQQRMKEDMQLSLEKEKALSEMKSRFVSLASHEFKTPLSVITSSVSLIEKYGAPEMEDKRLRHVQRIKSNVNNLKQLLNDFLSLEKLEEGVVKNNPEATDLAHLVEECIQDMEEACRGEQRIILETNGEPRPLTVDQHLLRNILNNLLSNAIKYSPADTPIRVGLEFQRDTVSLSVTDRGIGIPPEEQEHLFERFFRARNTTGISGTGLGLSIVKRYLDLMGGNITVASSSEGTIFTVILPAPVVMAYPHAPGVPRTR